MVDLKLTEIPLLWTPEGLKLPITTMSEGEAWVFNFYFIYMSQVSTGIFDNQYIVDIGRMYKCTLTWI